MHQDAEHGGQMSRSSSRSFICPDCGLGVESIARLTGHLLTHAHIADADVPRDQSRDHEPRDRATQSDVICRRRDDNVDEDMDTEDDIRPPVNHTPPRHDSTSAAPRDLDTHGEGQSEDEDQPTCLKVCQEEKVDGGAVVCLECPYCQRTDFESVVPLTSHIRTAHARPSDNLFTCSKCGLAFATLNKLEQHQRSEHDATTASTSAMSSMSSATSGSPVDSVQQPAAGARWSCRFCPVQFYDEDTLSDHESTIHLSRLTSSGLMTSPAAAAALTVVFCSQCSLGFPHIYALADHMHHSHGYNHSRSRSGTTSDVVTAAQGPGSTDGVPIRPLRPTAVRANSPDGSAAVHVPLTTGSPSVACTECSASFSSEDDLECHVTSTHYLSLGTEYGCTSCFKLFARPEDLQKHLMDIHTHHLYRCTLCKQLFDSKVNLQVHFAVKHSNECPVYRCSRCTTVFHSEMEWQLHVRVHHLGLARPFRCLFCREGFSSETDLAGHVASHNKPFVCPVCGDAFLVEFLLDRHLETHHRRCMDVVTPAAAAAATAASSLPAAIFASLPGAVLHSQVGSSDSGSVLGLSPVKREDPTVPQVYRDVTGQRSDDDNHHQQQQPRLACTTSINPVQACHNAGTKAHQGPGDKASGTGTSSSTSSEKQHICVYCTQAFKSKGELERHVKATHVMPTTSQKCNICDEVFASAAVLAEHKLTHCKVVQGNVCIVCRETMNSEAEFYAHCQQHHSAAITAAAVAAAASSINAAGPAAVPSPASIPCIVCRQTLVSALELTLHARHHYRNNQNHHRQQQTAAICCVCSTSEGLLASVAGPNNSVYYICPGCERRDGLISSSSAQQSYQCIKCQQAFASEHEVRLHVASHVLHDTNVHQCCLCTNSVTFDTPARLQAHVVAEHELVGGRQMGCELCGLTLTGSVAARQHALDHGPSSWNHVCRQCPLRFFFAAELRNHQLADGHDDPGSSTPTPPRASSTRLGADEHVIVGTQDDLRCTECWRSFSGYASLCSHRRVHDKTAVTVPPSSLPLDCSSRDQQRGCGSAPSSQCTEAVCDDAPTSAAVTSASGPLQCPECSRQFPSLSSLQGHMRVHSSGTKYSCDECGKSFSLPQNLAIHVASHRHDQHRQHECLTCHKRFAKKENLKCHMRSHSVISKEHTMTATVQTTTTAAATTTLDPTVDYFSVQRLLGVAKDTPVVKAARLSGRHQYKLGEHVCPICGGRFVQPTDLAVHLANLHNIKSEISSVESEARQNHVSSPADNQHSPGGDTSTTDTLNALRLYRTGPGTSDRDLHASPALSVK